MTRDAMTGGRRCGFTLPEVLVTVAVVVVLAAVLVPAVVQFAGKGDKPSLLESISTFRSALSAFHLDIGKYPADLRQLITPITTSDSWIDDSQRATGTVLEQSYEASDVAKWHGPYLAANPTSSGYFQLGGFGVLVGGANATAIQRPTFPSPQTGDDWWLITLIRAPTTCAAMLDVDLAVDGAPVTAGEEGTKGIVQWVHFAPNTHTQCDAAHRETGELDVPILRLLLVP
jgi:prepilin-type N-terminal cleavage/methylation domain-containing protein